MRPRAVALALCGLLAVGAPALAACTSAAQQAAQTAVEPAGGVDEDGNVTMDGENGGRFVFGNNVALPDEWPSAVPPVDGGTLGSVNVSADGRTSASWIADGSLEDVLEAYGTSLEAAGFSHTRTTDAGWDVEGTELTSSGLIVLYEGNGLDVLILALGHPDDQTSLSVEVTPAS